MYDGSGLQDILTGYGTYGNTIVKQLIKGKSYGRAIHAHELMMETLGDDAYITELTEQCTKLVDQGETQELKNVPQTIIQEISQSELIKSSFARIDTTLQIHCIRIIIFR